MDSVADGSPILKDQVALFLREEIFCGRLPPGEIIVEGKWATQLKVAQGTIREAINVLVTQGLVQKSTGRSARVTLLTADDVISLYEIRVALEVVSVRGVALRRPDLSDVEQIVADMRSAAAQQNDRAFRERDVKFHLLLAAKSGNPFLADHLSRILTPMFGFNAIRTSIGFDYSQGWKNRLQEHSDLTETLRAGDAPAAERLITAHLQASVRATTEQLRVHAPV
jgi:DNA-binding GntR family transcriptional regulator